MTADSLMRSYQKMPDPVNTAALKADREGENAKEWCKFVESCVIQSPVGCACHWDHVTRHCFWWLLGESRLPSAVV